MEIPRIACLTLFGVVLAVGILAAAAEEADVTEITITAHKSERQAIPRSNYVLHHTNLLQPGETETIEFTAPKYADKYPFLCS